MPAHSPYSGHFFVPEATNNSWSNMFGYVPAGSRVLDVGCSTGNFGEALERLKSCTVIGIDINEDDVEEARTRITEAHVFDIASSGARERFGVFDVIVFADVIEHLPDPRAALRSARDLLADEGVIVYSIPNMGHVSVRLDMLEGRFPYAELGLLDRTHLHFYDRLEVHDVLSSAGFTITSERSTVSAYPERWTTQRLSAIGLDASLAFFDMLRITESHIYQYIGTAVPSGAAQSFPPTEGSFVSPPDDILARANGLIDDVEQLQLANQRLREENGRLEREFDELRNWAIELKRHPAIAVVAALKRRFANRD